VHCGAGDVTDITVVDIRHVLEGKALACRWEDEGNMSIHSYLCSCVLF
jgi:hypothetical protein